VWNDFVLKENSTIFDVLEVSHVILDSVRCKIKFWNQTRAPRASFNARASNELERNWSESLKTMCSR